jgi:TetR/AcrR family transcriptional regulator, lmrAB and yxaGH operons repressor
MSAREAVIDSAIALIRRRGVSGTGMAALLDHSGVARRTVYLHFPGGKDEVIAAAVRQMGERMRARIARGEGMDPAEATGRFIDYWRSLLAESDFSSGCPVVAAALGHAVAPASAAAAGEVFAEWQDALAANMRAAGADAEDAARLATTVLAAVEGAIILCQAQRTAVPLERVRESLTELLGRH